MKGAHIFDGVAVAIRGDTFVSLWSAAALLPRVRWHAGLLEQHVSQHRGTALGLMIVLPGADPPDGEARIESNAIVERIGSGLRLAVTAAIGGTLQMQLVRTIMRGMFLLSGNSKRHVVVSTEAEGVERIVACAESSHTSEVRRAELQAMVCSLHEALGTASTLDARARGARPSPGTI